MAETMQFALPRPKRGLWALLIIYGVVGLVGAIAWNYFGDKGSLLWQWLLLTPDAVLHRPWTLLSAGLLTDPEHMGHLLFTLLGFYFLAPDLERRWGTGRFLRFVALSIMAGFGLSLFVGVASPESMTVFHRKFIFGPTAALAALAVAWGRENRASQIRLYFFLPISGATLVWITLGFCGLGLFFPASVTEGVASPFGGFIAGLLLAGSPSPLRTLYLKAKLLFLRRRGPHVHIELGDTPRPKKPRPGSPPLRVVHGGVEDELQKRHPPKDKRYLN